MLFLAFGLASPETSVSKFWQLLFQLYLTNVSPLLEDYISKFMYDNLKIKGMIELDFS